MIEVTYRNDAIAILEFDGVIRFARPEAFMLLDAPDIFSDSIETFMCCTHRLLNGMHFRNFLIDGERNEFDRFCHQCYHRKSNAKNVDLVLLLKTRSNAYVWLRAGSGHERTQDLDSSMYMLYNLRAIALRSKDEEECDVESRDGGVQLGAVHPLAPSLGLGLGVLAPSPSSAANEPLLMFEFDDENEWK